MCEFFWRLLVAFPLTRHLLSLFGIHVLCFVAIKICITIIIIINFDHRNVYYIDQVQFIGNKILIVYLYFYTPIYADKNILFIY